MAAQLINNLSTANKPTRQVEQDDLQRLMSEVSNLENSAVGSTTVVERLEHKHKLIYVFARAVLERLTREDPFMKIEQVILQASEALDIYTSTIQETPTVLAYTLPSNSTLQGRGQEPLWQWLFPRILALAGRRSFEPLTEKIRDFFHACFQAVSRSPKLWNLSSELFCYLKACSTSRFRSCRDGRRKLIGRLVVLSHLQNTSISSRKHRMVVVLPMSSQDTYIDEKDKETTRPGLQYSYVLDATDGLSHVAEMMRLLVDAASHHPTLEFENYVAWVLDCFLDIHVIQKRWNQLPDLHGCDEGVEESALCATRLLLSSLGQMLQDHVRRKGYILLSLICAHRIDGDMSDLSAYGRDLCSSLLHLAIICKQDESVRRAVGLNLVPTVQTALAYQISAGRESTGVPDYQRDFQVWISSCPLGLCTHKVPEICRSFVPSLRSRFYYAA